MKTSFLLALALLHLTSADTTKTGWSGTLSSLDAGLGGTITVLNTTHLLITNYKLDDASAPALYWWGSTTASLAGGFRISNTQVKEPASSSGGTYMVSLDAGKTTEDFGTVGLWCEKFSANFGQATLAPGPGTGSGSGAGSGSGSGGATPSGSGAAPSGTGGMSSAAGRKGVEWMVVAVGVGAGALFLV